MKRVILLTVLVLLISSGYSFADVPCKINYQGRLIKDNVPVHNPTGVPMTFTVDGIQVYTGDVSVYNGLFRVVLDLENIDWAAGEEKSLEVTVDGELLTPPEPIYAYPYAINSHLLEGKTTDYFVNTSGETQQKDGGLNIMGDVGIGTTNLGIRKLKVDGEVEATKYYGDGSALTGIDTGKWDGLKPGDIYYNEGNVGIGTTSPSSAKLHIVQNSPTTLNAHFNLNGNTIVSRKDTFTNLGTTAQDVMDAVSIGSTFVIHFAVKNIDNDTCSFTIFGGVESGSTFRYTHSGGANCAISETSEGVFAISGLGDGRTYTLTFSTSFGRATFKASSTAAGTTTLSYVIIRLS